jgi:lysosomal acid lipase/cholesteryl ester hydrolase
LAKKALLSQAFFWRGVLSWQVFTVVIDFFLEFLFGWKTLNIDPKEKPILYGHLYSYSSVKCLVHWFQITEAKNFQAFDDTLHVNSHHSYKSYVLPSYLPSRIKCPVALFYGGQDKVPDMNWLLNNLPKTCYVHKEEEYEHLDFLWAKNLNERIHKPLLEVLKQHTFNKPSTKQAVEVTTAKGGM